MAAPWRSVHSVLNMEVTAPPSMIRSGVDSDGTVRVELYGHWDLRSTCAKASDLVEELVRSGPPGSRWDLTRINELDVAGATLLWSAWNGHRPPTLALRPGDEAVFAELAALPRPVDRRAGGAELVTPLARLGQAAGSFAHHSMGMVTVLGDVAQYSARVARHPGDTPWRQISATIYHNGLRSLPITALVGFLIGIVLSYLSGQQLQQFGADSYIVNLMGIATLRELGPLLAAILNAGRSGSSMTAQIGVMRVTGELEAMSVMGISQIQRLVLPRVVGQFVALPLVILWTNLMALLGGMLGAKWQLGIAPQEFLHRLPQVVPVSDLVFGLAKGAVFGALVALVSCYFGLRIRPDTEGLSAGTTQSVVTSLTLVLVADAVFAILFENLGG
jgi:phospholipid/cholesterol/gamma-HCH transport system permease protein